MGRHPPHLLLATNLVVPIIPIPIDIDGESRFGVFLRRLCLGMEGGGDSFCDSFCGFEGRFWDALCDFVRMAEVQLRIMEGEIGDEGK